MLLSTLTSTSARAATAPQSAIGDEAPLWIAVSPDYPRSHMVVALATTMAGCSQRCMHLWVTRDGGGSWRDAPLPFDAAHVAVLTDGSGSQSVVLESSSLEQSDDDGASWHAVGPAGVPAAMGGEGVAVAVRGGQDYVLSGRGRSPVPGSDGADEDLSFAPSGDPGASLLTAVDPRAGTDVVRRCDRALRCTGPAPLPAGRSSDLAAAPDSRFGADGIAYARTATAVYRSTDGARTFAPVTLPHPGGAAYTAVAALTLARSGEAVRDDLVVALLGLVHGTSAADTTGGVFRSRDLGTTWTMVGSGGPLDGGATTVAAAPDGRLFAGYIDAHGGAGLLCSERGLAWHSLCAPAASQCTPCAPATHAAPAVPLAAAMTTAAAAPARATVARRTPGATYMTPSAITRGRGDGGPRYLVATAALALAVAVVVAPLSRLRRRRR